MFKSQVIKTIALMAGILKPNSADSVLAIIKPIERNSFILEGQNLHSFVCIEKNQQTYILKRQNYNSLNLMVIVLF